MKPSLVTNSTLSLKGADAPNVWTTWHDDGTVSVLFDGGPNQYFGFAGTPQEVRLALANGLKAIDRAIAERAAEDEADEEQEGRGRHRKLKPLYPELGDDLKRAGEQAARHKAGLA